MAVRQPFARSRQGASRRRGIRAGGRGGGRLAIGDGARLAGVSVPTVSRVVNNRPDVSPETREAVMQHVRALSFSTNRSARALSKGKTGLIGFPTPLLLRGVGRGHR